MKVPFLDLHVAYLEIKPEVDAAVLRVLDSGQYILGAEVDGSNYSAHKSHIAGSSVRSAR